jgi:hypothetical protein
MPNKQKDQLPPLHQAIVNVVAEETGQFSRSELAKLLVGSKSSRIVGYSQHPAFGRLAEYGRKSITVEIDILLQQQYLTLDKTNKLIVCLGFGS